MATKSKAAPDRTILLLGAAFLADNWNRQDTRESELVREHRIEKHCFGNQKKHGDVSSKKWLFIDVLDKGTCTKNRKVVN